MAKSGPGGDLLGTEVHRVFRMEGLRNADRADKKGALVSLPEYGRILASKAVLRKMNKQRRAIFKPAGMFKLKGFKTPFAIWISQL